MSDSLGSENLCGSDSTSAARHSFGNPQPIVEPSFEKDRKTIRPTRNFSRPRTQASLLRGNVLASSWTSPTVTAITPTVRVGGKPAAGLLILRFATGANCWGQTPKRQGSDPGLPLRAGSDPEGI